jgi:hypothetical protein
MISLSYNQEVRRVFFICLFALLSFVYVAQRIQLLEAGYKRAELEKALKQEMSRNEELRAEVAKLEGPRFIEGKFLAYMSNFNVGKTVRVVRIVRPAEKAKGKQPKGKLLYAEEISER